METFYVNDYLHSYHRDPTQFTPRRSVVSFLVVVSRLGESELRNGHDHILVHGLVVCIKVDDFPFLCKRQTRLLVQFIGILVVYH